MTCFKKGGLAASVATMCLLFADAAWAQDKTLTIGGRLMVDYTIADIDGVDVNAGETRRARLFASGKYGSNINYKFEFNHSSGDSIELTDGYVQFVPDSKKFKVKVGHFKTTNSFEEEASSRFISTIERGAFTDAFELNRRLGIAVNHSGSNYGVDFGAYGSNIDLDEGLDEGYAFSARGYYNPVKTDDTIAHIGASWRYRKQGDTQSDIRYRQRPYSHVTDRIINTDRFAESDNLYAVEGAFFKDNYWAAAEYAFVNADGSTGNNNADLSGGYVEAGMMIGGKRGYSGGKYNRPTVDNPFGEGGYGAIALVARYDTLDLSEGLVPGELDTIVLGADWWPTKQLRLALNYFDVDAEDNGTSESGNGVVGRISFDF